LLFDFDFMTKIILIFLAFALIHSTTVSIRFKHLCLRLFGETFMRVWYRFLYVLVSVITVAVAFHYIHTVPDRMIWRAPEWLKWYFYLIQAGAFIFGAAAFQYLDGLEFMGLRQVWRYLAKGMVAGNLEGLTEKGLATSGVYGMVRHPLYLAGMIILTFNPNVSVASLLITVLGDVYFLGGIFIEERRFLKIFGDQYREYQKRVPMLLPGIHVKE
jgi:protein-S-isoprenylcysteine O-methyltransferase Ste14